MGLGSSVVRTDKIVSRVSELQLDQSSIARVAIEAYMLQGPYPLGATIYHEMYLAASADLRDTQALLLDAYRLNAAAG